MSPVLVEVLEEYSGLGLRHGEPAIRGDGEPCDDDLQLRVTGKVVTFLFWLVFIVSTAEKKVGGDIWVR